ncbi:putative ADP-ribosylation factor, arf [Auriculariales sp. MPI-PUGE-AT-0066]|nr:putative ADP-ribosylation factor, arf [Auriculariales sp. MPI-PUGE-AT-0066]
MGGSASKPLQHLFRQPDMRILVFGLDAAGKTTILYKLKLGEIVETIPTMGFNVETVSYSGVSFTIWDVGSRRTVRPLWKHYLNNTQGLIFVIDSTDTERFDEVEDELRYILEFEEVRGVPILFLANKQDLPNAASPESLVARLRLHEVGRIRNEWYMQASSAINGDGLYQGLDWLASMLNCKPNP